MNTAIITVTVWKPHGTFHVSANQSTSECGRKVPFKTVHARGAEAAAAEAMRLAIKSAGEYIIFAPREVLTHIPVMLRSRFFDQHDDG